MKIRSMAAALVAAYAFVLCSPVVAETANSPKPASSTGSDVVSVASSSSPVSEEIRTQLRNIDAMKRLPLAAVSIVQIGNRILFVSENGRFVWTGAPIDLWSGRKVDSIAAANSLNRLDFERLGVKISELPVLEVGSGKTTVTVFVDPYCSACAQLMSEIPSLEKDYRFRLVMYPVLGEPSVNIVRKLMSMSNKAEAAQILIRHDYSKLDAVPLSSDLPRLQKALVAGRIFNFNAVPVIQYPNTEVSQGLPAEGFKKALEGNSK